MIHHLSEAVSYRRTLYDGPGRTPAGTRPGPLFFRRPPPDLVIPREVAEV
ncbi:hypothetical protein SSAG_06057 [Streptomyces sp. Mg1]|nr:hypothetical protein SSAG_06057 [Streptomyces sp. Mg1]